MPDLMKSRQEHTVDHHINQSVLTNLERLTKLPTTPADVTTESSGEAEGTREGGLVNFQANLKTEDSTVDKDRI